MVSNMFRTLLAHPQEAPDKAAFGILCACYVSWLHQVWSGTQLNKLSRKCITFVSLY
jgi:hypothetical protein